MTVFDMDLASIKAFVAVADEGGFRAAALRLGVTSAAVSKAVSRLEAQLGVMLLARTTRVVRLTSVGVVFHSRCKAILADLSAAGHEAAEGASEPHGRLVISVPRVFGRLRVLPIVAHFMKCYPKVEVELRLTDRVVDLAAEGVNLAIRIGHLPDSNLVASQVGNTRFVLCGSPDYLLSAGELTHPDELKCHRIVGYVEPDTAIRFTYRFLVEGSECTVSLPARFTTDDGEAAVAAAVKSVGLVMVNDYLVEQHIADGSLVRLLSHFERPPLPISIVQLPIRPPAPVVRALTDMLRQKLAKPQYKD